MHPRIDELLEYREDCRAELRRAVATVAAAQQGKRPAADRWSVAEIVHHLAIVQGSIAKMFRKRVPAAIADGLARETDVAPVLPTIDLERFTDRTHVLTAGERLQPQLDVDAESAWAALEKASTLFREAIDEADGFALGSLDAPHPMLGPLTFYGWIAFSGAHELRHAAQIREIVEHGAPPADGSRPADGSQATMDAAAALARVRGARPSARAVAGMAIRPVRTLLVSALLLVPLHVAIIGTALVASARFAGWIVASGGIIGTAAGWTATAIFSVAGIVLGTIAGLAAAASRTVASVETSGREALLGLAGTDLERMVPALPLAEARSRYESILDRLADEMLGRVRVPGIVRRLIKRGLRQAPVESFLADCEERGVTTVGLVEGRNWMAATGLPYAFGPLRAQIRFWRIVGTGIPAVIVVVALLLGFAR